MFLGKVTLKLCSKFIGEHPCRSAIFDIFRLVLMGTFFVHRNLYNTYNQIFGKYHVTFSQISVTNT